MMCDCISKVNAILTERNTRLTVPISFSALAKLANPEEPQRLLVVTEQIASGRGKQKACSMFASFCPFCGANYAETPSQSTQGEK